MALISGKKLEQRLDDISRNIKKASKVKVGFLEGATPYPDGTPVALVALINDFGAPSRGQPPRPFFRNMVKEKSPAWPAAVAKELVANNYDVRITLKRMGLAIAGQLRESITEGTYAPLAGSTIARKGFDKPLVDTGHMLNSVDYEVEE